MGAVRTESDGKRYRSACYIRTAHHDGGTISPFIRNAVYGRRVKRDIVQRAVRSDLHINDTADRIIEYIGRSAVLRHCFDNTAYEITDKYFSAVFGRKLLRSIDGTGRDRRSFAVVRIGIQWIGIGTIVTCSLDCWPAVVCAFPDVV